MNRLLRLAAAAAALAFAVAACGSGDDSAGSAAPASSAAVTSSAVTPSAVTSSAAPAPTTSAGDDRGGSENAATAIITIKDFRFGDPITVKPGAQVTVTNEDTAGHDVVSDDSGKFRTPALRKGEKAVFTAPTEPGTYKFSCSLHVNMTGTGTLVVTG